MSLLDVLNHRTIRCIHPAELLHFPNGIPNTTLSDNVSQFAAEFYKTVCHILGIRRKGQLRTTSETNGEADKYNRTINTSLKHYVTEHQNNWHQFVQPLTYAYYSQVHASKGTNPFILTITGPPPCSILDLTWTLSPTDDSEDNLTPSIRMMRVRILNALQ